MSTAMAGKPLDGVCGKCAGFTTNGEQHYCSAPQGFQWGRVDRPDAIAHMVPCEPFERNALCGVQCFGELTAVIHPEAKRCAKCRKLWAAALTRKDQSCT